MAEMLDDLDAPSDAELISRVRGGDVDAYGQLFARHVEAARRLARQLVRGPDSEDLVSDAFTKVMGALQSGGGPDIAFRAYLLTSVRRLHVDRIRVQSRLTSSDDLSAFDPGVPFQDTVIEQFESSAAARAFASLPERWQMVLWHLEVERQKPAEIAPLLGMTANSVSALAYRAREGLRQAFLAAHLAEIDDADCSWVVEHLGGYVRKGLPKRDVAKVESHLEGCRSCSGMHLELVEVNSGLSGVIAPLLLGGLAAGYLSATGSGIAAGGGVLALLDRAKDFVAAHLVPVSAGATTAGVAAAVVIGVGIGGDGRLPGPAFDAEAPPSRVNGLEAVGTSPQGSDQTRSTDPAPRRTGPHTDRAGSGTGTGGAGATAPRAGNKPPGHPEPAAPAPPSSTATTAPPAGPGPTEGELETPGNETPGNETPGNEPDSPGEPPGPPDPGPGEPPAEGQDISRTLGGNTIAKGIGRFRTHVANLPTGSGPTPLHLQVGFSDGRVHLAAVPGGCSSDGGGGVRCSAYGGTFNGLFDADMSALQPGESVTITVTVSIPDVTDPNPEDNTRTLTLTHVKP